jgi:vitamin B12 transporter
LTRFCILSAGAALLALSPAAYAQSDTADSAGPLEEIVVVANRAPEARDRVGSDVTVLDTQAIQASQQISISELLAETPGVTFFRNGGVGQPTSVSIRGAESDETLLLVDGVKLTDPSAPAGAIDFAHLLVGDVGRIEIIRGPQSTLWGSDAMGGVVNVTTAQPTGRFSGDAELEGGSRDTAYGRAGLGGNGEQVDWRVAAGYYTTAGIPALDESFGGRRLCGYENAAFSGQVVIRLTDDIAIDQRGYYVHGSTDFDGYPPPLYVLADTPEYSTVAEYVDYTGLDIASFDGALKNSFSIQYTEVVRDNYNPSLPVTATFVGLGRDRRFEYQGNWAIADGYQAVFGLESDQSRFSAASPAPGEANPPAVIGRTEIDSVYAQFQGTVLQGLTLTGGLRGDHHETFGDHVTGQAAAAWSLNDGGTVLRASFGQGFKAPSLYQLFSPYGNTSLRPETDNGWDAGIEEHLLDDKVALQASYFSRSTKEIIEFNDCYGPFSPRCIAQPYGFYDNLAQAEARGIEFEATVKLLSNVTLTGNYTYTESVDRSPGGATFGKDLARRPRNAANATATYDWPFGLSTTVALRYAGHSWDDAANTIRLRPYTLVDLRASYPINDQYELYGRIENIFDRHYETAYQYGQPGRGVFVGVRAFIGR